jgi:uncharacterized membrane protein
MYRIILTTLLFIVLSINLAEAHVCDDVLRLDPIEIRPEVQTVKIIEQGEFKIYLKNNYGDSIHNVRVIVPENLFDIKVAPVLIEKVLPRREIYFLVKITIPKGTRTGRYPLIMKVDAQEFEIPRDVHITIQVEKEEAVVEIVPEDIPIATSVFPNMIEVEPNQSVQFRVYVRNGHTESVHNIRLFVNESRFNIKITPEIIKEIKSRDKTYFLVDLTVPEELKHGDYMVAMELDADEFTGRGLGIVVRVGEVREEIIYIYLLIILFFISLLVWRWLALRQSRQHPKQSQIVAL